MTGTIATLTLDMLVVVLLAVTIGYCWILNRRIRILQDSKGELALLLRHFDESTQRASESIVALQSASKKIGETMQLRIDKANFALDDLSYMLERAGKLTQHLQASERPRPLAPAAEEEPAEIPPLPTAAPDMPQRTKTAAALEAVLEKIVGRGRSEPPAEGAPGRSKAEQELLAMIKSGMKG